MTAETKKTPSNSEFETQMRVAQEGMAQFRNALRNLANEQPASEVVSAKLQP